MTRALLLMMLAGAVAAACADGEPRLLPIADQTVVVGQTLDVTVPGGCSGSGAPRYEVRGLPASAVAEAVDGGLRLTWSPIASEAAPGGTVYDVEVRAGGCGRGGARVIFQVTAYPDGGVPAFLTPPGFVLDLATSDRISFTVEVKDDDSAAVELTVLQDLPGAHWAELDDRRRTITWEPTPDQVAERAYWPLIVGATDESHPMVVHTMTVVLANAAVGRDCPGTWPLVAGLQVFPAGGGVDVSALVIDPETPVGRVIAAWTTLDADGDIVRQGVAPMFREEELIYAARLDASALGAPEAVFAQVSVRARDNDDRSSTLCDHETRAPKIGLRTAPLADGACPDDAFGRARAGVFRATAGEVMRLRLCDGSVRTMEIPVARDDVLTAVAVAADDGPLRLDLAGEDAAAQLASVEGHGRVTLVRDPMADPGPARLTIQRPGGGGTATVDVLILLDDAACTPDVHEPDDTPSEARLSQGETASARRLCPGDRDIVRFELTEEGIVEASARFLLRHGDLDLAIVASDGVTAIRTARARTDDERLRALLQPGTYYLEVSAPGAHGPIDYTLDLAIRTRGVCFEDLLAPNGDAATAPVLPESFFEELMICPNTADHFRHTLNEGEAYAVTATPRNPDAPPLEIRVQRADGGEIGRAFGSLSTGPLQEGTHVIRVAAGLDDPVPYSFGFTVTGAAADCPRDRFEPNQTPADAPLLPTGWTTRLLLCPGEADHFAVRTGAPRNVRVTAFYASADEPLLLERVGSQGGTLEIARDEGARAVLDAVLPTAGTHLFRITPSVAPTFYDLEIELP